jgi:hypothetical protein
VARAVALHSDQSSANTVIGTGRGVDVDVDVDVDVAADGDGDAGAALDPKWNSGCDCIFVRVATAYVIRHNRERNGIIIMSNFFAMTLSLGPALVGCRCRCWTTGINRKRPVQLVNSAMTTMMYVRAS